jgi:hypothetical protein
LTSGHKDVRAREIQTKTLWNAHSTQRRRNTGEGLNIGLKKFNRIARIARINRIVVF